MTFNHSPFTPQLPDADNRILCWEKLYGSAKGLAIVNAVKQSEFPILIIASDIKAMENLAEEIRFFTNEDAEIPIYTFPDWEVLPYDIFSPYQDITSERIQTLSNIITLNKGLVITTISTAMSKLMPVSYLAARSMSFNKGDMIDLDEFKTGLINFGYKSVSQVVEHGEFAVRGAIIDLYPMGSHVPLRIDLFDDTIDSVRKFDPETQKSIENVDEIAILPANELDFSESGIKRFRHNWREYFASSPLNSEIYTDVSNQLVPQGIEFYLPFFFESTNTLFDYFNHTPIVIVDADMKHTVSEQWENISRRYRVVTDDLARTVLKPEDIYLTPDEIDEKLEECLRIQISPFISEDKKGWLHMLPVYLCSYL